MHPACRSRSSTSTSTRTTRCSTRPIRPDELVHQVASLEMPAVALTDHGNLFGAHEFYSAGPEGGGARRSSGARSYVAPGSRTEKSPGPGGRKPYNHLVLLAENETRLAQPDGLVTIRLPGGVLPPPAHRQGAAGGSLRGADRAVGMRCRARWRRACSRATHRAPSAPPASTARSSAPDNFFLEVQDHGLARRAGRARGRARAVGAHRHPSRGHQRLPLPPPRGRRGAPGADRHRPEQEAVRDGARTTPTTTSSTSSRRSRDGAPVRRPSRALARTAEIARALPRELPRAGVPPAALPGARRHAARGTTSRSWRGEGWSARLGDGRQRRHAPPEYWSAPGDRARRSSTPWGSRATSWWCGTSSAIAREHGIPVGPGRGSAAGSLVAYALRITDIDPLEYDLLFERFLNPERISMPDIDIDFCQRRRDEVIAHVRRRLRRGERLPDRHLQRPAGALGDPRRRPRDGACRSRRPTASPSWCRRTSASRSRAPSRTRRGSPRRCSRTRDVARLVDDRAPHRGARPALRRARRRRRHRPAAGARDRAPVPHRRATRWSPSSTRTSSRSSAC